MRLDQLRLLTWGLFLASALGEQQKARRYFLFETNLGEGFSMRRGAFLRASVLLRKVQEVDTSGAEWTLVLPPMTSHGWVSTENGERTRGFLPWGRFLNLTAMKKIHPRIIEIDEYLKLHPGADEKHINATIVAKVCETNQPNCECSLEHVPGWPGVGGFTRRNKHQEECVEHPLLLGISGVTFPHHLVCVPNDWMDADDDRVVKIILGPDVRESVYFHDKEQMVDRGDSFWAVRKHMLYSFHLIQYARKLHARKMNNRPFLGVHLRRGDFITAHPELVPSLLEVSKIIATVAEERNLKDIFIATDGTLGRGHGAVADVEKIAHKVEPKGIHVHSAYGPGDLESLHMGEFALVEQILLAGAEFFIGTQSSMFTDLVLQERAVHNVTKPFSALFEAEGDVGYDRPRAPNSHGVLVARGYEVGEEHRAPPYQI